MVKQEGFTLMEVVIYIALFSILMMGVVISAHQLLWGGNKNQTAIAIQEEGTFINRKLNWLLTGASVVSESGGSLFAVVPALGEDSPITLSGDGASIFLTRAGEDSRALNSRAFTASGLTFTVEQAASGTPQGVTVEFALNSIPFVYKTYVRN